MRNFKLLVILIGVALLALGVAACGDDNDNGDTETTKTEEASTTAEDKGTIVKVELGETSRDKYYVKVDKDKIPAGKVTFEITNVGAMYHEFIVYMTNLSPGDLPINEEEDKADLEEENEIGEAPYAKPPIVPEDKEPGAADHHIRGDGWGAELTVDLEAGKYVLLCNIKKHYTQKKQYIGFTVE